MTIPAALISILLFGSLSVQSHELNGLELSSAILEHCETDLRNSFLYHSPSKGQSVSKAVRDPNRPHVLVFSGVVTLYFLNVLENLPAGIDTIALELPRGGHAIAALIIADRIRSLGLNTYVGLDQCHSACTILFQGGNARIVDSMAYFTYHGPSDQGSVDQCSQAIFEYGAQKMVQWDFPEDQISVLRTPAVYSSFNSDRLLESGIATRVESYDIGNDGSIRKARQAEQQYCADNPEADDC